MMQAALATFFEELSWPYRWVAAQQLYETVYVGKSGRWFCYAMVDEAAELLLFYSVCPMQVPSERMMTVAEFITRVNNELIIGNFELNYETGQVLFKTSLLADSDHFRMAPLTPMILANVLMMDRYLPGIRAVVAGERFPVTAVAEIALGIPVIGKR